MSAAGRHTNGPASPTGKYIDGIDPDDPAYIKNLQRPAEVKEDLQQMENRSRVSVILNSQAFKEELEQVVEEQLRNGPYPASLIALQQITDLLLPHSKGSLGSLARSSSVIPINDLRGVESLGFVKGEKLLRCKLAALYRLVDLCGWSHGIHNHISSRVSTESEHFLLNPFGLTYSEITASSLVKVDIRGDIVEPGSTHLGVYRAGFSVHSAIHQARPDIKCIVHLHTPAAVAISALKCGLLAMSQEALICGNISYHDFQGIAADSDEREKLARNLGVHNKILILRNRGVLACGETVEEAFHFTFNVMAACEAQVKAMPVGLDNIVIPSAEAREQTYRVANQGGGGVDSTGRKWKTGELEFEALMRTLDNSGFRTGYVYKMPVVKQEKKERSNSEVEIPPSSSSFTYIFDDDYEHSKYASPVKAAMERQKKAYKAGWLTTPNAYKKTEVEEIGTTTPKRITKWVTDADSPNRPGGTPIKVDHPNQFAPQGANPKEYRDKQKSIKKDYYEERITAGPQSKILEGLTWDEAQRVKDGQLSGAGDQLIVVGAASKGIIQRDHQHNAVVYRQYYAANPFENMSEAEIEDYQAEVQRRERGELVSVEEEIPEPIVEVVKEATAPQRPPEPERRDTEARRSKPQDDAREVPVVSRHQPSQGQHTINEEAMLASLADRVVQTVIHDALSVARQGKGQQIHLGAEPLHKHHFLNHGPVGSQIIPNQRDYAKFYNGAQSFAVNYDKCSDFHHCNSNRTHTKFTKRCKFCRGHEETVGAAVKVCYCHVGATSPEVNTESCCQKCKLYDRHSEADCISLEHSEADSISLEHSEADFCSLEHSEADCSGLEHPEAGCSGLEHPEAGCSYLEYPEAGCSSLEYPEAGCSYLEYPEAGCSYLEHPEAGCSYLEHPEAGCSYLEHPEAGCSYLEHPEAGCSYLEHPEAGCSSLKYPEAGCSYLEYPEAGCSSLEHLEAGEHPVAGCSSLEHLETSQKYSVYIDSMSASSVRGKRQPTMIDNWQPDFKALSTNSKIITAKFPYKTSSSYCNNSLPFQNQFELIEEHLKYPISVVENASTNGQHLEQKTDCPHKTKVFKTVLSGYNFHERNDTIPVDISFEITDDKNVHVDGKAPIQIISPIGCCARLELSHKPYVKKWDKHKIISTSEDQHAPFSAKSPYSLDKTNDDLGCRLFSSNSTCLDSHHQNIRWLVELGLALHAKSKENLIDNLLYSDCPKKEKCSSPQIVSDSYNLMNYSGTMTFICPPVIIAYPVTRDSPMQGTTGAPRESDSDGRPRFERHNRSAQSSKTTESRRGTSQGITGSESPSSRQKWVPKQKQEKVINVEQLPDPVMSEVRDKDRTHREHVRSDERNYGRQAHKRDVDPAEGGRGNLKGEDALRKAREEKKMRRNEEAHTSHDEMRQRGRDLRSNRRKEDRRDRQHDDYEFGERKRDRDYVYSRRGQEYTDDYDDRNEPNSRKVRNYSSGRTRRDDRELSETRYRHDLRRERGNELERKYVESDANTETDNDESSGTRKSDKNDQLSDSRNKSEDKLIKELKGKIEDRKSRMLEKNQDIEKQILFGKLIREAEGQKPIQEVEVQKYTHEAEGQNLIQEVEGQKVDYDVDRPSRKQTGNLTTEVDDLSVRQINSATEPVEVKELSGNSVKEKIIAKTDSDGKNDAWENESLGFENRSLGFENRRGDYRDRTRKRDERDRKSSHRYRGRSEDRHRHRRRQDYEEERRNSDDERRLGKRDNTLNRTEDNNKENESRDTQQRDHRTYRSKRKGEGQNVLAETKVYSVNDSSQRNHRNEERERSSRKPIDRGELSASPVGSHTAHVQSDSTKAREKKHRAFDTSPNSTHRNITSTEDVKLNREHGGAVAPSDGEFAESELGMKREVQVERGDYDKRKKKQESPPFSESKYSRGTGGSNPNLSEYEYFPRDYHLSSQAAPVVEELLPYTHPLIKESVESQQSEERDSINKAKLLQDQVLDVSRSVTDKKRNPDIHRTYRNKKDNADKFEKPRDDSVYEKMEEMKTDSGVFKQVVDSLLAANIHEQSNKKIGTDDKNKQKEKEPDLRETILVKETHKNKQRKILEIPATKDKFLVEREYKIPRIVKGGKSAPRAVPEDDMIIGDEETVHRHIRATNVYKEGRSRFARERDMTNVEKKNRQSEDHSNQEKIRSIKERDIEDGGRAMSVVHKEDRVRSAREKDSIHFDEAYEIKNLKSENYKDSIELSEEKDTSNKMIEVNTKKYKSHVLKSQFPKQNENDLEDVPELSLKGSTAKTVDMINRIPEPTETHFDFVPDENTLEKDVPKITKETENKIRDAYCPNERIEYPMDITADERNYDLEASPRDKKRRVENIEHKSIRKGVDGNISYTSGRLNKRFGDFKDNSNEPSKVIPNAVIQVEGEEESYSFRSERKASNEPKVKDDFEDNDVTETKKLSKDAQIRSSNAVSGIIVKARREADRWYPVKNEKSIPDEVTNNDKTVGGSNKDISRSPIIVSKFADKTGRESERYYPVRGSESLLGANVCDEDKKRPDMDDRSGTSQMVSEAIPKITYQAKRSYPLRGNERSVPEADFSDEDKIAATDDRSSTSKMVSEVSPKMTSGARSYPARRIEKVVLETDLSDEDKKRPTDSRSSTSKMVSDVPEITYQAKRSYPVRGNGKSKTESNLSDEDEKKPDEDYRSSTSKMVSDVPEITYQAKRSYPVRGNGKSKTESNLSDEDEKKPDEDYRSSTSKMVSDVPEITYQAKRSYPVSGNGKSKTESNLSDEDEKRPDENYRSSTSKMVSDVPEITYQAKRSYPVRGNEKSKTESNLSDEDEKRPDENYRSSTSKMVSDVPEITYQAKRSYPVRGNEKSKTESNLSDEDEKRPDENYRSSTSKMVSDVPKITYQAKRSYPVRINETSKTEANLSDEDEKRPDEDYRSSTSKMVSDVPEITYQAKRSYPVRGNEKSKTESNLSDEDEKRPDENYRSSTSKMVSDVPEITYQAKRSYPVRGNEKSKTESNLSDEDEKRPDENYRSSTSKMVSDVPKITYQAKRSYPVRINETSKTEANLSDEDEKRPDEDYRSSTSKMVSDVPKITYQAKRSYPVRGNEKSKTESNLSDEDEKKPDEDYRSSTSKMVSDIPKITYQAKRSYPVRGNEKSKTESNLSDEDEKKPDEDYRSSTSKMVSDIPKITYQAKRSYPVRGNEKSKTEANLSDEDEGRPDKDYRSSTSKMVSEVVPKITSDARSYPVRRIEKVVLETDLSDEDKKRPNMDDRSSASKMVSEVVPKKTYHGKRSYPVRANEISMSEENLSDEDEKRSKDDRSSASKMVSEVSPKMASGARSYPARRIEKVVLETDLSGEHKKRPNTDDRFSTSKMVPEAVLKTAFARRSYPAMGNERSMTEADISDEGKKKPTDGRSSTSNRVSEAVPKTTYPARRSYPIRRNERSMHEEDIYYEDKRRPDKDDRSSTSKVVSESVPKAENQTRRSYPVRRNERSMHEEDIYYEDKRRPDKDDRSSTSKVVSESVPKAENQTRRSYPVRRNEKSMPGELSIEDKKRQDKNDRTRTPKMGSEIPIHRIWQSTSGTDVLKHDRRMIDERVNRFHDPNLTPVKQSDTFLYEDYEIPETVVKVQERQKYAGFVKRTGRSGRKSHPMRGVSLEDDSNSRLQDELENTKTWESKDIPIKPKQSEAPLDTSLNDHFSAVVHDNPIELAVDNNDEKNQPPLSPKKSIFNLFSCVGGRSADAARMMGKSKKKRPTAYYEEGEKRKIKKISKEKEKEEKKVLYFEKPEETSDSNGGDDSFEDVNGEPQEESDESASRLPDVQPPEMPNMSGRDLYQKRSSPFHPSKPSSRFIDPAPTLEALEDASSEDDKNPQQISNAKKAFPEVSSTSNLSDHEEGKFSTFMSFGKSNISPGIARPGRFGYIKSQEPEIAVLDGSAQDNFKNVTVVGEEFLSREKEHIYEVKTAHTFQDVELRKDRSSSVTMDINLRPKSSRVSEILESEITARSNIRSVGRVSEARLSDFIAGIPPPSFGETELAISAEAPFPPPPDKLDSSSSSLL